MPNPKPNPNPNPDPGPNPNPGKLVDGSGATCDELTKIIAVDKKATLTLSLTLILKPLILNP